MNAKSISVDHRPYTFLKLVEQYQKTNQLIVAYDFDDTVSPLHSSGCWRAASAIRKAKEVLNAYCIVYTCNDNYAKIIKYLDENNIPWDAINENAPFISFGGGDCKIYYNILLDDKAGLHQAIEDLEALIYGVMNGTITKENK